MKTAKRPTDAAAATVLVVDDESLLRMTVRHYLVAAGYRVLDAPSAEEALARHAENRGAVAVLLTDVMLAGMTGHQLAERVAREDPAVAVVYMSAYPEDHIVAKGRLPGGARLLKKPFTPEALLETVRQAVD